MLASTAQQLQRLAGVSDPAGLQRLAGYRLRKLADPAEDFEAAVDLLDGPAGPRPNPWLARRRQGEVLDHGDLVLEGRRCCGRLVEDVRRQLHRLRPPTRHECPGCGTVYVLEAGVVQDEWYGR